MELQISFPCVLSVNINHKIIESLAYTYIHMDSVSELVHSQRKRGPIAGLWLQCRLLYARALREVTRNKAANIIKLVQQVCMYLCICVYVCMHVFMHVCICMFVCMHVYTCVF